MKSPKVIRKTSVPLLERVQMWVSARFRLKMDLIAMWECLRIVVSMMKMVWLWLMVGRGPLGFEARPLAGYPLSEIR